MQFDWLNFFRSNNIPYAESGPNTSRGHVSTHCVWCGQADRSMHLSVSLEGKGFRCFRNPEHKGKNPARLVQALINCSWERACQLTGTQSYLPDNFVSQVKKYLTPIVDTAKPAALVLPKEFKEIKQLPSAKPYISYLRGRGFGDEDIFVAHDYGVYYCTQGPYKGRVIFTIEFDGKLVGWTGRSIYPTAMIRYKTLSDNKETMWAEGYPAAFKPISHYLLWYDRIKQSDADTVVLCEGPFDAWRVNLLGKELGIVATCFFTISVSQMQQQLLHELLPMFKNRYLMLDSGTLTKALRLKSTLSSLGVEIKQLPETVKDPALLSAKQFAELF